MKQLDSVQIYFMYVKFLNFIENEELKELRLISLICKNKPNQFIFIAVASQNERQQHIRVECSIFQGKNCCSEPMKLHYSHVTQWRGN